MAWQFIGTAIGTRGGRLAVCVLATCVLAAKAPAQGALARRLSNGILIVVVPQSGPRLDVVTQYLSGFRDEPDSLRGIAHLVEHLGMRETRAGVSLAAATARNGWSGGASTTGSVTSFVVTAPAGTDSVLAAILRLERHRMVDLALDSATLAVEARRIEIEVGGPTARSTYREALFPGSRMGRASEHRGLARVTTATARAFYERHYAPANAVITIQSSLSRDTVVALAERALGSVPSTFVLPRPVARDSVRILPALVVSEETESSSKGLVASIAVPGLQHVERPAIEREFDALRQRVAAARIRRSVELELTDDAPVALLRIRVSDSDTIGARSLVDSIIGSLARVQSAPGPTIAPRKRSAPNWVSCEAAGDWRYCIDLARVRDQTIAGDEPLPLLSRIIRDARRGGSDSLLRNVIALWPAPMRIPPTALAVAETPTAKPMSIWTAPDTAGLRWQTSGRGARWAGAAGGRLDTVFFAAWIAMPARVTSREIAALEVFARTFGATRLPDGSSAGGAITRLGGSVAVTPLPYPPLATSDPFRMLGTPITPVGAAGLQVVGSAPVAMADAVLRTVAQAITEGHSDSAAVSAELVRQLPLLTQALAAQSPRAEVAFRRSAPVLPSNPGPAWRPEELPEQLRVMQSLTVADVAAVPSAISSRGAARLAILGADAGKARAWVETSRWSSIAPLAPTPVPVNCESARADRVAVAQPATAATVDVYFSLCIPIAAPLSVPVPVLLASAMLGNREDAAVAKRLRGETGLAYSFENRIVPTIDGRAALWFLRIGTQSKTIDSAIGEVQAVLARVSRDGVSDATVADFRDWYAAQRRARALDGLTWVTALVTSGASPEQEAERATSVTTAEVNAALRHWDPRRMIIVRPVTAR